MTGKPCRPRSTAQAERRQLCSDLIVVRWNAADAAPGETTANLEEISAHGAGVQLEAPLPVGTEVEFPFAESAEGAPLAGVLTRCEAEPGLGYYAEVRFHAGCTWSEARYRPQHLFDPNDLVAEKSFAQGA